MCRSASMIVTRTRVLWSKDGDSHEQIIKENKLSDSSRNPDFVRVEIVPPGYDYGLPFDRWGFAVDQDILPDWWHPAEGEAAARAALPDWAAVHIIREGHATCETGQTRMFFNSSTGTLNGGDAWFYDSSTGTVNGGVARFYDSSTGTLNGGGAKFYGSSTGTLNGGDAWFYGSSTGTVNGGVAWFCYSSTGTLNGGDAWFYGSSTGTVNGGYAWFYDSSTGTVNGGDAKFCDKATRLAGAKA